MHLVKSLLLGTAAGWVAAGVAHAADMPAKAKPVQYVKICSLYGDGYYYIPGTDTCLKLGGYLRVQAEYNTGAGGVAAGTSAVEDGQARFTRDHTNDVNFRTRGVVSWDVRQHTEYGVLRTFIRIGIQQTTPTDTEAGAVYWDRAFMQFAGFTVGKARSFFDLFSIGAPTPIARAGQRRHRHQWTAAVGLYCPNSATASPPRCRWRTRVDASAHW